MQVSVDDENKTIIGLKFYSKVQQLKYLLDENKTIIGLKYTEYFDYINLVIMMKIRL